MPSFKRKSYDYSKVKRNWLTPLWWQRFHHRHPTAWMWTSGFGMFVLMYYPTFVNYYKKLVMDPGDYKAWLDEENYKHHLRIRYGEGIRLPFSSTTVNLYSDREIELLKARDRRVIDEEKKLLTED